MNDYEYIWNPKVKGSGIITCIPQEGICPNNCPDCFFQNGRSYLEPLKENLPHMPPQEYTERRVVRINDGNDSNVERTIVEETARRYRMCFFNTAIPKDLEKFNEPVVLTINPGVSTDEEFYRLSQIPDNLMFVRIRTNPWNLRRVVHPAIEHYTRRGVAVVLTFMAYFTSAIPEGYKNSYTWKRRTLNSYFCLRQHEIESIMRRFGNNPFVYSCGVKGKHECMFCGNCLREYFNAMERMRGVSTRVILDI